jgi:hypothetical protein
MNNRPVRQTDPSDLAHVNVSRGILTVISVGRSHDATIPQGVES